MTEKILQPHAGLIMFTALGLLGGCMEIPANSAEKNDLASMATAAIEIIGRTTYTAYVADSNDYTGGPASYLRVFDISNKSLPV